MGPGRKLYQQILAVVKNLFLFSSQTHVKIFSGLKPHENCKI